MNDLQPILDSIWGWLELGVRDPKHPFRTVVFATRSEEGCGLRTMVLRRASGGARSLGFYSDNRSSKVREMSAHPRVEILAWDPAERVQVRVQGLASVRSGDSDTFRAWEELPEFSRCHYITESAPGTPIPWPDMSVPELTPQALETGFVNFSLVEVVVDRLEWLFLGAERQRRAVWAWDGSKFEGSWVVP